MLLTTVAKNVKMAMVLGLLVCLHLLAKNASTSIAETAKKITKFAKVATSLINIMLNWELATLIVVQVVIGSNVFLIKNAMIVKMGMVNRKLELIASLVKIKDVRIVSGTVLSVVGVCLIIL